MSSYYQTLANNQHEMMGSLAEDNIQIENANIRAKEAFDKSQDDLQKRINDLSGKLKVESGKKEVVEGVPISEDDIAELVGGKATYNLIKNTAHAYSKNVKTATETLNPVLSGESFLQQSARVMAGEDTAQALTKGAKFKIMGQSVADGFKQATQKERVASDLKTATQKAVQEATQAGKSAEEIAKAGEEAGKLTGLGKVVGKIGAGVAVADGISLINSDIEGFQKGEGWDALGKNWEEKTSNVLGIAGDALSLFPPTEILGGITDIASGFFDWLGEGKEDTKNIDEKNRLTREKNNATAPPPQKMIVSPQMSSIGMVSNIAHPVTDMIAGSGSF